MKRRRQNTKKRDFKLSLRKLRPKNKQTKLRAERAAHFLTGCVSDVALVTSPSLKLRLLYILSLILFAPFIP